MNERFSLGRVLADTGQALKARWPLMVLVIATVQIGLPLLLDVGFGVTAALDDTAGLFPGLVSKLILLAVDTLVTGLLIHLTLNARSPMREALASAPVAVLKACLSLYAITLIARCAALLAYAPLYELRRRVMSGETPVTEVSGWMSLITLGASTVGMVLSVVLVAAKPAAVDEGLGPIPAIRRNFELTRGRRWLMAGLVMGAGFIVGMTQLSVIMAKPPLTESLGAAGITLFGYAATPVAALSIVFLTCVYRELRRLRDPGPGDRVASLFD